jgi:hypothetical protein
MDRYAGLKMPTSRLTKKQRLLVTEIRRLLKGLYLDPDEIVGSVQPNERTGALESTQKIIRLVLRNYMFMEDQLSSVIRSHFFGNDRILLQLMKLRRFRSFNHFILERAIPATAGFGEEHSHDPEMGSV